MRVTGRTVTLCCDRLKEVGRWREYLDESSILQEDGEAKDHAAKDSSHADSTARHE